MATAEGADGAPTDGRAAGEATLLLRRWTQGDVEAESALYRLLYAELQDLAQRHMRGREAGNTLQPTALVNDAWMKLVDADRARIGDREHFLSLASRAMRCILVDRARRRGAEKRGGVRERVPLDLAIDLLEQRSTDLVALSDALDRLSREDDRLARIVELRFFGGLTMEEAARALDTSLATAERAWRLARLWLRNELGPMAGGA